MLHRQAHSVFSRSGLHNQRPPRRDQTQKSCLKYVHVAAAADGAPMSAFPSMLLFFLFLSLFPPSPTLLWFLWAGPAAVLSCPRFPSAFILLPLTSSRSVRVTQPPPITQEMAARLPNALSTDLPRAVFSLHFKFSLHTHPAHTKTGASRSPSLSLHNNNNKNINKTR